IRADVESRGLGDVYKRQLSGVGSYIGGHLSAELKKALPQRIGAELIDPKIPALFQNIGKPNPYPNVIGNGVGNIIGGSSVFIPLTSTEPESDM
uniref:hypothetical protein n=1 Tax=Microvirgula aerodenitrificans TaxID=57480 RepID=UPI00248E6093